MKVLFTSMLILTIGALSGCAIGKNGVALDPVGPSPNQPPADNATNGTLVVYSAFKVNADFNNPDPYHSEHSDFRIFTTDGKFLQRVHNISNNGLRDVVPVALPPGKYNVIARANGYGYVAVPVMIVAQQNTILHLEGDGFWPDESAFNRTNAVRLPDGVVIGWKAAPN